jgi:hypothetical protein
MLNYIKMFANDNAKLLLASIALFYLVLRKRPKGRGFKAYIRLSNSL